MATVTQYEDACAEIVYAFADALRAQRARDVNNWESFDAAGESNDVDALNAAFEVAKKYGWDWETDTEFVNWCLKATHQEICTEGLRRALGGVKL